MNKLKTVSPLAQAAQLLLAEVNLEGDPDRDAKLADMAREVQKQRDR